MWDLFISHAWEDKDEIARPLAKMLAQKGLNVWYDESILKVGDSLRRSIDTGLEKSRFGIVILSPNFFKKEWSKKELDALVTKEGEKKVILPIWHNIEKSEIQKYSPLLSDKLGVMTSLGLEKVVDEIFKSISLEIEHLIEFKSKFKSLFYSQDIEVKEDELQELDYEPEVLGGWLFIEVEILGLDKLPHEKEPQIKVHHDFDLSHVLIILRDLISLFNKRDKSLIKFYQDEDSYYGRIGEKSNPVKRIRFSVESEIANDLFKGGYHLQIEDDLFIFHPYEKGNSFSTPQILFNQEEHSIIKKNIIKLIELLTNSKLRKTKLYPTNELGAGHGGFGYEMPLKLNQQEIKLDE